MTMETTTDARSAVLRQLAMASTEFDAIAREYIAVGMFDEAEVAHDRAMVVNEAYKGEADNRPPKKPCGCPACNAVYAKGRR